MRVRKANTSDLSAIRDYLWSHWRRDHIFVRSPNLLEWQHASERSEDLNFILAEGQQGLQALLGFIPMRRFDSNLRANVISLALWHVSAEARPGLGLRLLRALQAQEKPEIILVMGLSDTAAQIYKSLGYEVGLVQNFFLVRSGTSLDWFDSFVSGRKTKKGGLSLIGRSKSLPVDLKEHIQEILHKNRPEKSWDYLLERYEQHPWYSYEFFVVGSRKIPRAVFVARRQSIGLGYIWRIVDAVGELDDIAASAQALQAFLDSTSAEYLDFLSVGIQTDLMVSAGFNVVTNSSDVVLPHLFDPLTLDAPPLSFALNFSQCVRNEGHHFHIADCDQDRPNKGGNHP